MLKSMQPVTFPVNCTRSIYTFHQGQRGPATTESEPYCRNGGFRGAPLRSYLFPARLCSTRRMNARPGPT